MSDYCPDCGCKHGCLCGDETPPIKAESSFAAPTGLGGKRETPLLLPNDTKIRFCNAFDAIKAHVILCKECDIYLRWGDGDLCGVGKTIIAQELCYAETSLELQSNEKGHPHRSRTTN